MPNNEQHHLTDEQFNICFRKGTEPPGSGRLLHEKRVGIYHCVNCGSVLFPSTTKYDSGTGWPSFWDVADVSNIKITADNSLGVRRSEVQCATCEAHLGHVFDDGPSEYSGKRYCINSLALTFKEKTAAEETF